MTRLSVLPPPALSRRRMLALGGMAGAALAAQPGRVLAQELFASPPDTIITDALIITQDTARPRAEAVAIRGGLIQAVGSSSDILARRGPATRVISAGGRTLIPGLNDSHQHPTRAGRFYATELRWDGVPSLAQGLKMIREAARKTPKGQWMRVVGGWSPYQFAERRLPTPAELTAAAPDTPVYVLFLYSQGYLNRKAVEVRGLTPATKPPYGTRYEFTPDGGCILHATPNPDLLYGAVAALPSLSPEEQALSTRHYYRELNRFGLTSVIDAGGGGHSFPEDYAGTDALAASGALTMRISTYLFPQRKGAELAEFEAWTRDWQAGVNRAEELLHGYEVEGGGETLTWSAVDYENFMADRPALEDRAGWDAALLEVTRHLLKNRWPLRIHATYDESIANILNVFEKAHALEVAEGRDGFGGVRWAFDHGETLKRPTIERIKALGGGLAMQARMAYAGEYFLERYGEEATRNAPPLRDVIEAGVPLGLGTDATRVASYNPWPALYWATTGKSLGGTQLHGERHRLSREEALFHYTVGSAWFSQEERLKGRIKPGQYADFALLNGPYLDVADDDLKDIEADLTVLAGKPVHAVGDFKGLATDLPAIEPEWSPVRAYGGYHAAQR
ncbi:amidohydrolase [Erythrobacter donghaensis]|uniref:amidohydrolase n=1 Tax=Erythrobacter donghaensis TaxID=267135 RepID=UPI00093E3AD4|nr:amidohydrolase [Erythrobacter donghaensis]